MPSWLRWTLVLPAALGSYIAIQFVVARSKLTPLQLEPPLRCRFPSRGEGERCGTPRQRSSRRST